MWLRVKVIGAIAVCVAIPLLSGYATVAIMSQVSLRESATNDLQAATTAIAIQLEDRLAQDLAHLKSWATSPVMQDVLIADDGGDIARALPALLRYYGDFASLTLTDARGTVLAATAEGERNVDLSHDEAVRAAASGRTFQSTYGFRSASAPETIWFTVPIIAAYDRQTVVGTLTGVLDFKAIAKGVMARSALAAQSRTLLIEGRDGRIVFSSRTDANLFQALHDLRGERTGVSEIVWQDEPYFVATAAFKRKALLRDPGFVVRGIAPGTVVFAQASDLTSAFGLVAALGVLAALGLAWRWSLPLVDLGRAMDRLARGDTSFATPAIAPEHAFGRMARALEVFRQARIVRDHLAAREQALHRAKEDAEAAALAKAEHLASLSRELRTQLNSIIGLSELINRETLQAAGGAPYASYAKDIGRSGVQLLAVINDLFDLSEAEAGHLVLDEADVDLAALINDGVEMMREAAEKAKVALVSEGCDVPVRARIDAHKTKQILFNLLSNAVRFTEADGHVCVRLQVEADDRITIVVTDDGIGMPGNLTPIAMMPFTPAGDASGHGRHGAGLGLPLVKRLVELHQGAVEIESEVGKGTTVTVTLPSSRTIGVDTSEQEERLIA